MVFLLDELALKVALSWSIRQDQETTK